MHAHRLEKVIVAIGTLLAVNGGLLLISPARFASLRKSNMFPHRVNDLLDGLARDYDKSRPLGLSLAILGLVLLATGFVRTPPTR